MTHGGPQPPRLNGLGPLHNSPLLFLTPSPHCAALDPTSCRTTNLPTLAEDTIFKFVDQMEASELCALLGSCSLLDKLLATPMPRLSRGAIGALAPVTKAAVAAHANANGAVPNDNCDTCKVGGGAGQTGRPLPWLHLSALLVAECHRVRLQTLHVRPRSVHLASQVARLHAYASALARPPFAPQMVVAEMHSALANPDLQAQVTEYAKAVCASMGSFADACK
jgi:hypothetical protein